MKPGWKQMPSGRWVTTRLTKHGHASLHAWESGRWEVARDGRVIASGSVWTNDVRDAMDRAENWTANLITSEE